MTASRTNGPPAPRCRKISQKLSLPLRTVTAISNAGELESGESVTDLPQQKDLLTAVFDSDIDVEADPIDIGNTGFAWYNVTDIIPSRERELDEVHDDVVAAWKAAERTNRNAALANEILDELEGGKNMQALAEERGLSMESASGISRQGNGRPSRAGRSGTLCRTSGAYGHRPQHCDPICA